MGHTRMSFYNNPAEDNLVASLERPTNLMLVRSELGKTKRSTFDLPADANHAYGVPLRRDEEGCGKVISSWKTHGGSRITELGTNFAAVNKTALRAGATTATQVAAYRAGNNDIKIKAKELRTPAPLPSDGDLNHTYGRKVRPFTPIGKLMTGEFQRSFCDAQWDRMQHEAATKPGPIPPMATRASLAHQVKPKTAPKAMFKLSKFEKVQPKLGQKGLKA